jgi:DNA invertase Pin-like site-specific DNA recombinase
MGTDSSGVAALGWLSSDGARRIDDKEMEEQLKALERHCARSGWRLVTLVHETGEPRRGSSRPALDYAFERLGGGHATCLLVSDLGRLCRSVAQLRTLLDRLDGVGARLVSLQPPIDTGTRAGRDAAQVLCAISDWERIRAAERSRRALAAAREQGAVQPGIEPALRRRICRMRGAGMTLQAIVDELNSDGVPTARGGATWRPSSVQAAIGYKRPARA